MTIALVLIVLVLVHQVLFWILVEKANQEQPELCKKLGVIQRGDYTNGEVYVAYLKSFSSKLLWPKGKALFRFLLITWNLLAVAILAIAFWPFLGK